MQHHTLRHDHAIGQINVCPHASRVDFKACDQAIGISQHLLGFDTDIPQHFIGARGIVPLEHILDISQHNLSQSGDCPAVMDQSF